MIITQHQFYREFEKIKKSSLTHSTCKLAIFVSCFDIDAIVSSKMLSDYFKNQFIVFQLIPVIGYIDLKEKYLKLDNDITNIILIGCGATADLESFLEIDINNYLIDMTINQVQNLISIGKLQDIKLLRKIYIIDGHRPWNLDNLYGSPIICCLDDNSTDDLSKEKEAFYYLINQADEEDEEEEEEEEEVEELADEEDDDDEDLDLEESLDRKRHKNEKKESLKVKKHRLINEYQDSLENYYQQGSTISIPSAHQVYDLLSTIGEISIDHLWLAIIGSRSLRDSYRRVYDIVYPGLKNEVQRLQSENDSFSMRSNNSNNNVALSKNSLLNYNISKKADSTGIQIINEYNLFLLHHWTIFDSFFYSNYVNLKNPIFEIQGRKNLKTMLARMGISLIQANQNWHYVDLDLKKRLNDLIDREAHKINLIDIIFKGFQRNYGFHGSISSGDFVESIQALLECGIAEENEFLKSKNKINKVNLKGKNKKRRNNESENNNDDNDNDDDEVDDEDEDNDDEINDQNIDKKTKDKNEQFLAGFWRAYDSLNNYDSIIKGMNVAKFQQQFIFEKGSEIILKEMIKMHDKFKYVVLNESFTTNSSITRSNYNDSTFNKSISSLKDDRVVDITSFGNGSLMFQNPLILTKLGNWILNAYHKDGGLLPLLIAAYNNDTETYLICGLPSRTTFDDDEYDQEPEEKDDEEDDEDDYEEDEEYESDDSDEDVEEEDYERRKRRKKKQSSDQKKKKKNSNKNKNMNKKSSEQKVILNAFSVLFEKVTQEINIQARMDSFQSAIIEIKKEDLSKFLEGLASYSHYMM